ncbi:UxaA family hydrolase [Labilibacter marinus]|uniref:UxaA family hydrolase n=1 Tax=Labilibacter marinus TaxID=1477105 RepID=UPI00094F8E51|nr:altronate dehydratase family protein [Labilibacter marinus]
MIEYIKIHKDDNAIVALKDLTQGTVLDVEGTKITLIQDVPAAHKVALQDIPSGEIVRKYGFPIGHAKADIKQGEHIHTQNLKTGLSDNLEYSYSPTQTKLESEKSPKTFLGYPRKNGDVGIRNELWIIPTVGCVNGQAKRIIELLKAETDTSHIDDIMVLSHQYGCSQLGDDHSNTRKALAAAANHPNAGAVLVLGLGCENNQIKELKEEIGECDQERVRFLVSQDVEDEVETGLQIVKELAAIMKNDERSQVPVAKLKIGLKCGGSDAFSGITANPLLGAFSDWLIAQGGSTILTEVPEMFGAETTLMDRAKDAVVFEDIVTLINDFKDYFRRNNQVIYENPSPGNKAGGITTLEEKSLGCVQKGGGSTVIDVLNYGDAIKKPGLSLLWSPGNDLVASSALALSGCQMVLFTTGRGTPFGSFVPTMKISSNSSLFNRKKNWMDFNAGSLLESKSMKELCVELTDFIIDIASGQELKHEISNFKELAIFKSGVTL